MKSHSAMLRFGLSAARNRIAHYNGVCGVWIANLNSEPWFLA